MLCFKIGENWKCTEYSDTEHVKLEEKIPKVLAKIEAIVQEEREWKEQCVIAKMERERKEEIERQIKKAKDDEYHKFKDFYKSAHRWHHYMILKNYFEMIESTSKENNDDSKKDWLDWAKIKLDWFNPTLDIEDELLNDIDKDAIV